MTTFSFPLYLSEASSFVPLHAFAGLFESYPVVWTLVILVLVAINAFFVAAEVALVRVHIGQLEEAIEENRPGAGLALAFCKQPEPYLAACQFGITLSSLILGAVGEPFVSSLLAPTFLSWGIDETMARWISFFLSILFLTLIHTILGEQIPRTIGYRKTVATSATLSPPLRAFYLASLLPVSIIRAIADFLTKIILRLEPVDNQQVNTTADELKLIVEDTARAQEVTETEFEILENALELNELCVRDILTPRNDVVVLDVHRTFKENLDYALESKHTRFPLVDGHLDQTLGLIHIKDLLRELQKDSPNLFAAKRDLIRVSELLPLDEMLKLFLAERAHMALVVDEFGGSVGLVMLDDVLDQVVGEIHDEFDDEEEPGISFLSEDEFVVMGSYPLHELTDEVGELELEDPNVSTVGGYVTNLLGRIPEKGETVRIEGFSAEVLDSDDRSVGRLHFTRNEVPESTESTVDGADESSTISPRQAS
ncbi:MAG: hemolysin family protein [Verrucomicrobiota bacterium]